jgi:DNA-binding MarR family transcriptional regulator
MEKSKSSTKVSAAGKGAKSRSRTGARKPTGAGSESPPAAAPERPTETKQARFVRMLQREGGASVAELAAAMGWLPHTTRAALTRLRQSGRELVKAKRDTGETSYRIADPVRQTRSRKAA